MSRRFFAGASRRACGFVRRALRLRLVLGLTLALVAAFAAACQTPPADEAIVDPALVAFLSKARAAHHRADLAEQDGRRKLAIEAVSAIIDGPRPESSPEVIEVVADARARRADLKSQEGDFDGAAKDVDEGLASALAVTHFRGHLYEVGGLVAERRAAALRAAGDDAGAAAARERAIALYEQAIEVQDAVIRDALGDGDAGTNERR